ncbi:uncharacterized protein LOC123521041 [Echinops telfairi]|uniref:Uncharacterized protein LOC123521041 n=1 Tax=Echinops telfairi TaxID=9371 RepID=A0AC55CMJ7_ECHTE|nr:uncharacterized protein LOC123521041 [Echinops telfairi]
MTLPFETEISIYKVSVEGVAARQTESKSQFVLVVEMLGWPKNAHQKKERRQSQRRGAAFQKRLRACSKLLKKKHLHIPSSPILQREAHNSHFILEIYTGLLHLTKIKVQSSFHYYVHISCLKLNAGGGRRWQLSQLPEVSSHPSAECTSLPTRNKITGRHNGKHQPTSHNEFQDFKAAVQKWWRGLSNWFGRLKKLEQEEGANMVSFLFSSNQCSIYSLLVEFFKSNHCSSCCKNVRVL